jgi:hypothetical protein
MVRSQMSRLAVFVVDLAERQPGVEHAALAVVAQRPLPADVALELGNKCG